MTSLFDVRRAAQLRNARLSDDRPIRFFFFAKVPKLMRLNTVSKLHGNPERETWTIGVRAIRPIKRSTYVFAPNDDETAEVSEAAVKDLPKPIQDLYDDFCVLKGDKYVCPSSFNKLTPLMLCKSFGRPKYRPGRRSSILCAERYCRREDLFARYPDYSENEERKS